MASYIKAPSEAKPEQSLVPARLDRLGWSRFHSRLVIALGVAWILDGLEITIASNLKEMFLNLTPANDLRFRRAVDAPTVRIDGMTMAGG